MLYIYVSYLIFQYKEYWGWKYAEISPIEIPSNATMKIQSKTGYEQIQYKWSDGTYKYDARWHTRTPGAPAEQGNTWGVERTTPGNAHGQNKVKHILTGEGVRARAVENHLYLRSSSKSFYSDVVHEGIHGTDFLNGYGAGKTKTTWQWEKRAYYYERQF